MDPIETSAKPIRTIRLDERSLGALLGRLEAKESDSPEDRRKHPRFKYRVRNALLQLQQPGAATPTTFVVPTRNISRSGLGFLHGGFVHQHTLVRVQLLTRHGAWHGALGQVSRCQYLEAGIYEVAVEFEQEIEPSLFCADANHHKALLAEADAATARLVGHYLSALNCDVDVAENGRIAAEMATKAQYDLVLLDMNMAEANGFEAVRALRNGGFAAPIVAAGAMKDPGCRERCLAAGCNNVLSKPYTRQQLSEVIAWLSEEPLYSTVEGEPGMAPLVAQFVQDMPRQVRALEEALARQETGRLETLVHSLKAHGAGYGFSAIAELAGAVEASLQSGESVHQVFETVEKLIQTCTRARCPRMACAAAAE